jgi:hypothetical protein
MSSLFLSAKPALREEIIVHTANAKARTERLRKVAEALLQKDIPMDYPVLKVARL